ncbi:histidine phosphatase family protein [Rhodococcus fascians]|uniref:SixA phosphatase family protein n=1 Tax=Rhodococcoides fascians TaxID=1828 RepID=UPI00195CE99B|nr:histidine phosphatase family protein [Rhodococcus fascians]MBM7243357.1 histidine phosphatase family protein [Rhodococcus fascians]MBY3809996.1 histidine phosphatase family protein [Rhodococcus fascians]MBY3841499.1 histidine phosphatase family protein [Rhodococcus fascians]MBY3844832.1 histidine phosphatase family protein [Rhodococcus fascians]MBY3850705.1 histidine phosphatase family protein [Rhodococcus fascians]
MATTRTLVLMRHGKSGYPDGVPDHERPLAPRGQREAGLAGAWITEHVGSVDAVLCSTALRTRETLAATGLGDAPTRFERDIYGGSADEIIDEIKLADTYFDDVTVSTLLVVGHEPGIPWTALELAVDDDTDVAREVRHRFPTSAIAVLTTECSWAELAASTATITEFCIPRADSVGA